MVDTLIAQHQGTNRIEGSLDTVPAHCQVPLGEGPWSQMLPSTAGNGGNSSDGSVATFAW